MTVHSNKTETQATSSILIYIQKQYKKWYHCNLFNLTGCQGYGIGLLQQPIKKEMPSVAESMFLFKPH